jgi:hypothetical protein
MTPTEDDCSQESADRINLIRGLYQQMRIMKEPNITKRTK